MCLAAVLQPLAGTVGVAWVVCFRDHASPGVDAHPVTVFPVLSCVGAPGVLMMCAGSLAQCSVSVCPADSTRAEAFEVVLVHLTLSQTECCCCAQQC